MATIYDRVRERLSAVGKSPRAASLEAGLNPEYIRDLSRRKTASPGSDAIEKLAPVLKTTASWLLNESGPKDLDESPFGYRPPPPLLGSRDLPIFAAVEGGPGEIVYDTSPIELVPRPWYVANVQEAFGVHVVGESMIPVIRPGQIVVVNPKLGPIPGESAIFINRHRGEFKATIKELRRSTAVAWHVYQYNPPVGQQHEFDLPKAEWPEALRVVGWFAGR